MRHASARKARLPSWKSSAASAKRGSTDWKRSASASNELTTAPASVSTRLPSRHADVELVREVEAFADETVDAPVGELAGEAEGLDGPGHDDVGQPTQVLHDLRVEQTSVDRYALQAPSREAVSKRTQLAGAADRMDDANAGITGERLERSPVARADGDPSRSEVRVKSVEHAPAHVGLQALEVEHELGCGGSRTQQLGEEQPRREGVAEPPAIPEERYRADSLQVAHLECAPEEVDVSLDERRAERLGPLQQVEIVAVAMGDDERGREPARAFPSRFPRAHCQPV